MAGLSNAAFDRLLAIVKSTDAVSIPVGAGKFAIVDPADADLVSRHNWNHTTRYATTWLDGRLVLMHRLLMSPPDGMVVDHKDGDGLNNQRYNLRICSHQQNMCNRVNTIRTSRFKGVHFRRDAWHAQISVNGEKIKLGCFTSEVKAARAYDRAAKELHGEFAKTNADLELYR